MPLTPTKLAQGWTIQVRNIRALMVRDIMMRYGRGNIGFAWVVLEPMILTAGVMIIWSFLGSTKQGVKIVELVLTGYMPLTLWRHLTINSAVFLLRRNAPLLYHRQLTLFDFIVARQLVEFSGITCALAVVWTVLNTAGLIGSIQQPMLFLWGWLMMGWIAMGAGAAIAAMTEVSEAAERFVQPLQYLNIPISGAFFLVEWLPPWGQHLILYHPLVHCYEVFRAGFFGASIVSHYNIPYFIGAAFVVTVIGVYSVYRVRTRIQLQ